MRPLVTNVDESFFQSVQIALDANGIRHVDSMAHCHGEGVLKYSNCVEVDEGDFERARALALTLQRTSVIEIEPGDLRRYVMTCVILAVIVVGAFWIAVKY
jgi:hypothetical protein